jgi:hypothetical protein
MQDEFPELLSYKQAAQLLHRSVASLRRDVMRRRLPTVKLFGPRGRVLFSKQALIELIEARTRPAKDQVPA